MTVVQDRKPDHVFVAPSVLRVVVRLVLVLSLAGLGLATVAALERGRRTQVARRVRRRRRGRAGAVLGDADGARAAADRGDGPHGADHPWRRGAPVRPGGPRRRHAGTRRLGGLRPLPRQLGHRAGARRRLEGVHGRRDDLPATAPTATPRLATSASSADPDHPAEKNLRIRRNLGARATITFLKGSTATRDQLEGGNRDFARRAHRRPPDLRGTS